MNKSVTTLRVSPPNQRPFDVHVYTAKLTEKLAKYPGAVVLGETTTPAAGIVPTHIGKTIQQERAEKVAAKLASQNQQRGTKREVTKEKRASEKTPKLPESKTPKLAKTPKLTRAYVRKDPALSPRDAKPCVCLSTRTYYPTLISAQASMQKANRALQQSLSRNGGVALYNKRVFAYATDAERTAGACLRTLADVVVPPSRAKGNQHIARTILHMDTGRVFGTVAAFAKANHTGKKWLIHLEPGEIRHTPAGPVRLVSKAEAEQWKQKQSN